MIALERMACSATYVRYLSWDQSNRILVNAEPVLRSLLAPELPFRGVERGIFDSHPILEEIVVVDHGGCSLPS